jgi:hypothetical protein
MKRERIARTWRGWWREWRQFCPGCGAAGLGVVLVSRCEKCGEYTNPLSTAPPEGWPQEVVAWSAEPIEQALWHGYQSAELEGYIRLLRSKES